MRSRTPLTHTIFPQSALSGGRSSSIVSHRNVPSQCPIAVSHRKAWTARIGRDSPSSRKTLAEILAPRLYPVRLAQGFYELKALSEKSLHNNAQQWAHVVLRTTEQWDGTHFRANSTFRPTSQWDGRNNRQILRSIPQNSHRTVGRNAFQGQFHVPSHGSPTVTANIQAVFRQKRWKTAEHEHHHKHRTRREPHTSGTQRNNRQILRSIPQNSGTQRIPRPIPRSVPQASGTQRNNRQIPHLKWPDFHPTNSGTQRISGPIPRSVPPAFGMECNNRRFRLRVTGRIVTRRSFAPFSRRVTDRPGSARHSPVPNHCNSAVLQSRSTTTEHHTRSKLVTRRSFTRFLHRVTDESGLAQTGTDRFSTAQPRIMHKSYAARGLWKNKRASGRSLKP